MPSEAALAAMTDQWRAHLNELVTVATEHLTDCPQPQLDCPGGYVQDVLKHHTHRELFTLMEIAVVAIVRLRAGNTNMVHNAETLAEEVLQANAVPAHWCRECGASHA